MSETAISIDPEDPRQADVRDLLAESDAHMAALYPPESNHMVDAQALAAPDMVFLAARRGGELLGSVALRAIAPGHGEMKRLFVRASVRGMGLGRQLLLALEEAARRRGIARISLETGIRQARAIGLYHAHGYRQCPPFGDYRPDLLSLFMTRRL